jgi:hypothetical protein
VNEAAGNDALKEVMNDKVSSGVSHSAGGIAEEVVVDTNSVVGKKDNGSYHVMTKTGTDSGVSPDKKSLKSEGFPLDHGYPIHSSCIPHIIHWIFSNTRRNNVVLFSVTDRLKEIIKISHSKHIQGFFDTKCTSFSDNRWFGIDISMDWVIVSEDAFEELLGEEDLEFCTITKQLQPTIKVFDYLLHYFEDDSTTLGNVFYTLTRSFSTLCHCVSHVSHPDVVEICTQMTKTLYMCTLGSDNCTLYCLSSLFTITGQALFSQGGDFVCFVPLRLPCLADLLSKTVSENSSVKHSDNRVKLALTEIVDAKDKISRSISAPADSVNSTFAGTKPGASKFAKKESMGLGMLSMRVWQASPQEILFPNTKDSGAQKMTGSGRSPFSVMGFVFLLTADCFCLFYMS